MQELKKIANGEDIGKPDALIVRSQTSVTLKKGAKGEATWEIKIYGDDPDVAAEKALELHKKFEKEFNG